MFLHFSLIFCPTTRPSNYNNTQARCTSALSKFPSSLKFLLLQRSATAPALLLTAGSNAIHSRHRTNVCVGMSLQPLHAYGRIEASPEYRWSSLPSLCGSWYFALVENQKHWSDSSTILGRGEPACWTPLSIASCTIVCFPPPPAPFRSSPHHCLPSGPPILLDTRPSSHLVRIPPWVGAEVGGKRYGISLAVPVDGMVSSATSSCGVDWRTWFDDDGERPPWNLEHCHKRMAMRAAIETKKGVDVDKRWEGPGGSFASARRRDEGGSS